MQHGRCQAHGVFGQRCSKTSLFTCFWEASAPKHTLFMQHLASHTGEAVSVVEVRFQPKVFFYSQCFGPGLLQNIAIYTLLGGQCSQTPLFTHDLASHMGGAVSVVETGCQPKVSLFTVFRARAALKHRYLHAFGRPVLPNIIIYTAFALSCCQVIASSLDAFFVSVVLLEEFTLGVLFVAHVPAS